MRSSIKFLLATAGVALLAACGGGGGGGEVKASKAETLYPLSIAFSNYANNSSNISFTYTGSITYGGNTDSLTGSGTYIETTASSTFNGASALRKTQTTSGELIIDGTKQPISDVTYYYFSQNYQPLGYTNSAAYCVSSNVKSIPAFAAAGDSGEWYTTECYTNSSKAVRVGSSITSYQINYVTDATADLVLNQIVTDSSGRITAPVKSTYRISSTGSITFNEQTATIEYGGDSLTLTVKAGGGGSTGPVASTSTFDLRAAYVAYLTTPSSNQFDMSGTIEGTSITGSGTATAGSVSSGTFEGLASLKRSVTISGTLSVNGQSVPINSTTTTWTDTNYVPRGSTGSEDYEVVVGTPKIPTSVRVNDTGILYTSNRYTDDRKQNLNGTVVTSYVIEPYTATTATVKLIETYRETGSTITDISTVTFRIDTTNRLVRLNETLIVPAGQTNLTVTYR